MSTKFGVVTGAPKLWLRVEGVVLFAASIALFAIQGQPWWLYPAVLFVPDVFMLGYLRGPRLGAIGYNLGHATPLPAALTSLGLVAGSPLTAAIGAIWLGHIGWDRAFGYGLKYPSDFKHTHLGDLARPTRKPTA